MILSFAATLLLSPALADDSVGLARRSPEEVGMSAETLASIDHVVGRGISAGGFPGAAVVVGRNGGIVWEKGYGRLTWGAGAAADARTTLYDVASLTKVVATTTAIMILHDRGRISLDDRVSRWVPSFKGGLKSRVTIRDLLTHRSGLPAGRELHRRARTAAAARRLVIETPLRAAPGTRTEYSDVGYDVLGFVAEAAARQPLDRYLEKQLFSRLRLRNTLFRPSSARRSSAAPTENSPPRGYPIRGEVHDESAFALGGVAGHAGLFSTAADLAVFAQMMLDGGVYRGVRIVSDSTVALFTRRTAGTRALGWDTCAGGASCGRYLGPIAYGHTGYTGTSMWIDPERRMFVIVLTNWVHAPAWGSSPPLAILHDVRSDIADIAARAVCDAPVVADEMPLRLRADLAIGWRR